MTISFGVNTGFALNRYTTPEQWVPIVGDLNLDTVQITADILNPFWPDDILWNVVDRTKRLLNEYHITNVHLFTGAFTRVNHFSHPDHTMRQYWLKWFKRFIDVGAKLNAISVGSHLGILTSPDNDNPNIREERLDTTIDYWHKLSKYAISKSIQYLTWEPMSVSREYGETINSAKDIQSKFKITNGVPIYCCLDVDHGDVSSTNAMDTDPYAWIKHLGAQSPLIHIKQSSKDKGGHWPFIDPYNKNGKIEPRKILSAIDEWGFKDTILLLELSFREREPFDRQVISSLEGSVNYWKPFLK